MNLFPTLVVDDFLDDPDYVLNLAENTEYNDPGLTNYPGVASKNKIYGLDQELFDTILQKIFGYYWDLNNPVKYIVDMEFLKIEPKDDGILNKGIIHRDDDKNLCAGIIYLNKDPQKDTGTSFFKLKDSNYDDEYYNMDPYKLLHPIARYHSGQNVDGIEDICQNHYDKFEETMRVQNQYNRLCWYSSNVWHSPTSYGNQTRYTIRWFVHMIDSKHQNFPLLR